MLGMKRRLIEGLASETIGTVRLSPRSSINVARCSLSCESNVCDVILRRKELPSELEHLSWAFRNKLKPVRFYLDFRICSAYNQAKKKAKQRQPTRQDGKKTQCSTLHTPALALMFSLG